MRGQRGQREEGETEVEMTRWMVEARGKGLGVEKTQRARVSRPVPRWGLQGPRTRTHSQDQAPRPELPSPLDHSPGRGCEPSRW